jgi:predicted alpha-1,2-mannosidase
LSVPRTAHILSLLLILARLCSPGQKDLAQYVNPFIGTGGHGHTFPGAVLPFGMVQLSPDTRVDGSWDGCSGYHYSDSVIYGFSHTHLSGTGCSDWGDMMLMPMCGKPSLDKKNYSTRFSHGNEKAEAGYYSVLLDNKVRADLTVTLRTGIHQYNFPTREEANIIIDLLHRDKLLRGEIRKLDNNTIVGYRVSQAWAKNQHCYFAIKFSQEIKKADLTSTGAMLGFGVLKGPLMAKVAISGASIEGALLNLSEAPHWNFESYKKEARNTWNDQLQKIVVKDNDKDKLTVFYTALYHCFIHPSLNIDLDSKYRGRDNEIHTGYGQKQYNVFSLWDTYRGLHPLFTIIERERTGDFIKTFLRMYKESGRLPVWELSGNETDCMIGYHSVSVIADAFVKGITDIDTLSVFKAMKAAASYSGFGIPVYSEKKYLDSEDEPESVSRTLEYAYDDWCIAQMAMRINSANDYNYFLSRAQSWKNVFDPKTGFMRPRKNGNWIEPFDPKEVNNHFTEGNSWQYSFYVPQDIETLMQMHGGEKKFETKLDSLFSTGNKTSGRNQADITGLIGQYAHGNEPSHHMAYLYNYVGRPDKTQEKISFITKEFYKNAPDGLIGNEDCGQMSAWFVLSAMGFYPVCPGLPEYVLGKPLFDTITINLENGKKFVISKTAGNNGYVKNIELNGNRSLRSVIYHNQIIAGGKLNFVMENSLSADNAFGKSTSVRPASKISSRPIVPAPLIVGKSRSFEDRQEISLVCNDAGSCNIVYTTDGSEPDRNSKKYTQPFTIEGSCTIRAKIYSEKDSSSVTSARFYKKPNNWTIQLMSKYNEQYTAGGPSGIIDGIYGDVNWRKGEWQGYQYQDFECVIDMKEKKPVKYVMMDFLQDTGPWIIFPAKVEIMLSDDGVNFRNAGSITHNISPKDYTPQTKKLEKEFAQPETARYVKLIARNFGKLPEWHEGKGDGAFIFIDEIEIR